MHAGQAHAQFDMLHGAEWICIIAKIIWRNGLHDVTRLWPHDRQDTFGGGDVGDHDVEITHVTAHPRFIGKPCCGGGDDQIGGV